MYQCIIRIFDQNIEVCVGVIFYDQHMCNIVSVHTYEQYRNKGFCTLLLQNILLFCNEKHIQTITLDDCTDNFNRPNNVYLKFGFHYINEGEPEMIYSLLKNQ